MAQDTLRGTPEKAGYVLEWHDEFDGAGLDLAKWVPYYLPQWSSRSRSAPNYQLRDSCLVLQITEDQQPWCPEFDGEIKASSVQTGLFAGPVGSRQGQLQFSPQLVVREAQTNVRLYTPQYGYIECRARCCATAGVHVSLWMIGYEDVPAHSGEIAVFEVFGKDLAEHSAVVCSGVHPWGDPALSEAFYCDPLPIDATQFHRYAVEWTPRHIDYFVDDQLLRRIEQSPAYPLQLMLSIFERPGGDQRAPYPREFAVDYVRVYQPQGGYE
ncbi:MAG: glycoside hydrolase family 16 protein [Chloroflexota bacterium]|nr:MAG: glycoside hydrolase [Chloroflexota bacterium]